MDQKTPLKKAQKQQQQQATSSSRFDDLPCESCEESRDSRTIERIWGTDHGVVAIYLASSKKQTLIQTVIHTI